MEFPGSHQLLLAAVQDAPRRYRMPRLPPDAQAAALAGPETALAFAIEAARRGQGDIALRELFTQALASLITRALDPQAGDPALQALLLRQQDPVVAEHVALAAQAAADRRRVRTLVDAFAHPGKLRRHPDASLREPLSQLHALASDGDWRGLRAAAQHLLLQAPPQLQDPLRGLLHEPALSRIERVGALQEHPSVQRYLALCGAIGPLAGSEAAARTGLAAAKAGDAVEAETLRAFATIGSWLDAGGPPRHQALRTLRPVSGLPRAARGVKDEWDVALVRHGEHGADIVLLAECKASPAAAASDWPRLRAGLAHLAGAEADAVCVFSTDAGELRVRGDSLRTLALSGPGIPPQVMYCCSAVEARVPLLAAAARSLLLQEPASLAFADALTRGAAPPASQLASLFDQLPTAPRLFPVLQQYETARLAREAMLHPDDLLAAAAARLGAGAQGLPRNR